MNATIACDFCALPLERDGMEGIKVSASHCDSEGDALVIAQTYFFGHSRCLRAYYRSLLERKLDLFKYPPVGAPERPRERST